MSTSLLSSAPRTLLSAFAATDANGNGTIANYKFQVPTTTLGSFYIAASGGMALVAGSQQTLTSANTLYFEPNGTGNGTITFDYTATDNAVPALTSAAATYTISLANVAPVAAAISTPVINNNGSTTRTQLPAFSATDPDGTVVNYRFTVPTGGFFYTTATGGTALATGSAQTFAPGQVLYYLPHRLYYGYGKLYVYRDRQRQPRGHFGPGHVHHQHQPGASGRCPIGYGN